MNGLWENTKNFFKKKYTMPIVFGLLTILLVPVIVSLLMECPLMDFGSQKAESWMSFWGGYLGAILGIAGAITATTIQIKSQTGQIVMAAEKNDELERKRMQLTFIIEKNTQLYEKILEVRNLFENYFLQIELKLDEELGRNVPRHDRLGKVIRPKKIKTDDKLKISIDSHLNGLDSYKVFILENQILKDCINTLISEIRATVANEEEIFSNQSYAFKEIKQIVYNEKTRYHQVINLFDSIDQVYTEHIYNLMGKIVLNSEEEIVTPIESNE